MSELVVGKVLKPQGIRGEVKVLFYTDDAETFKAFKRVFIGGEEYKILSVRTSPEAVFLGLRGVPDRNAAELLRGKEVCVPREEAPEPEEGSYYIADLVGCAVVTEDGTFLGTLAEVRQAATDIYTLSADGKETLFPAAKGVVLSVDVEKKEIVVSEKRFREVAVQ